jgi:hypothetical protein
MMTHLPINTQWYQNQQKIEQHLRANFEIELYIYKIGHHPPAGLTNTYQPESGFRKFLIILTVELLIPDRNSRRSSAGDFFRA